MRRPSFVLTAIAAAALALAPALADARPGGGASSGSRGSRTYSAPPSTSTAPGQARQMDRTMTEPSRGGAVAQQGQRTPIGQPNPAGGFFSRSPFMAGLMGGLIGVGLGGLLFGHGLFGGFTGMASFLGLLLQLALIGGLVWLVVGFLRRRSSAAQPAMAGIPNGAMARQAQGAPDRAPRGGAGGGTAPSSAVAVTPADFEAFERTLKDVNAAWSRQDLPALQRLSTPEMAGYFSRDLNDLAERGWRNETRDVALEQGDLSEAWREGQREFATVAMRFSLVDVTRQVSDGAVVEGDPSRRTEAVELWTFQRTQDGPWLLSAIQQTAKKA
ncbi:MAG: Integral membrane protein [uncultured Acetobacteraceae bacterium]|uniref:Integral membrane protein n=1 Tax=uncultured Acetobacteraceae bacterium TaxID=169975 RepID=A0A6J4JDV0_9PROT|nr:MAG: Integral membrane protein [uncultured Acetobacteraceae bacterium]